MRQTPGVNRFMRLGLALLCLGVSGATQAATVTPALHALVIGNQRYAQKPLQNPVNDAELMGRTLHRLGYRVTRLNDLPQKGLYAAVRQFSEQLPTGAVAVVYYAGHGLQLENRNYLLPIDAVASSPRAVAAGAYPVDSLLASLATSRSALNVVILDACRNNPFLPTGPTRYRDAGGLGLRKVTAPTGTVIAYSTAPNQLAADGPSRRNSLFTATLAAAMLEPGLPIEVVLKKVAEAVRRDTLDDQHPWFESSLIDEFYFIPPKGVTQIARRPAGAASRQVATRGADAVVISPWFRTEKGTDWQRIDAEIMRRAEGATADELPSLLRKAEAGNVTAQTVVGLAYRQGVRQGGTGKAATRQGASNPKALKWLGMAAKAGFPVAQLALAEMYSAGHGVDRSPKNARDWLKQAATANYPRAQMALAELTLTEGASPDELMEAFLGLTRQFHGANAPQPAP